MRLARAVLPLLCALIASGGLWAGGLPESGVAIFPSGAEFDLEIKISDEDRALGYMFREFVGPDQGMLFLFDRPGRYGFWMKNCRVNLDLIWLDQERRVVHIAHDQPPCREGSECDDIVPDRPGIFVLEVAGGIARHHELKIGDLVEIVTDPALP